MSIADRYTSDHGIKAILAREAEYGQEPSKPSCPQCGGLATVKDPEPVMTVHGDYPFGVMIPCPICSEPQRRRWLSKMCGLSGDLMDARSTDWAPGRWDSLGQAEQNRRIEQREKAKDAIVAAVRNRHGFVTFYGDFGSGKTFAQAIICNELRNQMVEAHYVCMPGLLDHLRSLYGAKRDTSEYWQRLLDIPVLALDEITRINPTDWAREKLFVLVNTRYERRRSHLTLFGLNDDPNQHLPTATLYGYLYSRMREGATVELRGDVRPALASRTWWDA